MAKYQNAVSIHKHAYSIFPNDTCTAWNKKYSSQYETNIAPNKRDLLLAIFLLFRTWIQLRFAIFILHYSEEAISSEIKGWGGGGGGGGEDV